MMVDSSAWIEYLRATASYADRLLTGALANREPIWMPMPVYQEVLQGAASEADFARLQLLLSAATPWWPEDLAQTTRAAAHLYARCRWQGVTVRSPNDCLIAASAIEARQPLLHADRDFERIATVEPRLKFA